MAAQTLPGFRVIAFLVLFDVGSYWTHRWFHGSWLWEVSCRSHHSSQQLDWLSTVRHHPVNDVAMRMGQRAAGRFLGFSPQVVAWSFPVLMFHSLLIHANVPWRFGPLGWVIVSPAYHHWHHTTQQEGRDKNFAELFPILDILFGTYYSPFGRQAEQYGIDDPSFPQRVVGQLLYPFRRSRGATAVEPERTNPSDGSS